MEIRRDDVSKGEEKSYLFATPRRAAKHGRTNAVTLPSGTNTFVTGETRTVD